MKPEMKMQRDHNDKTNERKKKEKNPVHFIP